VATNAPLRAFLYSRVSTEEQGKKYGLDSHVTAFRAWCATNGHTNAGEYLDRGVSGGTLDRPELNRIRADVKLGRGDIVVVPEPSRLSRVHHDQIGLAVEFRKRVRLVYLTLPDGDGASHELLENITSAIGQFERSEIRRKTHSGRLRRAAEGRRGAGRPAFGLRIGKDGRQEPDPTLAPVVRQLFEAFAADVETLSGLLRELANLGLRAPRGGAWSMSTLHAILTNRVYIGEGVYNRRRNRGARHSGERDRSLNPEQEWVRFAVPPIVSVDLFDRVQAKLKANAVTRWGRKGDSTFTLRRLLFCPTCHRMMVTHSPKPAAASAKRYRYYSCQPRGGCGRRFSAPVVEAAIRDLFKTYLRDRDRLREKLQQEADRRGASDVELRSGVDHAKTLADKVAREVANLEDLIADPDLRSARVEAKLRDARSRAKDLDARLRTAREALARVVPDTRKIDELADAIAREVRKGHDDDHATWSRIFHAFLDRIDIDGDVLRPRLRAPGGGAGTRERVRTADRGILSNPPVLCDVSTSSTKAVPGAYALSLDPGAGFVRGPRAVLTGHGGP
jgi:site-specific DNA recombinase